MGDTPEVDLEGDSLSISSSAVTLYVMATKEKGAREWGRGKGAGRAHGEKQSAKDRERQCCVRASEKIRSASLALTREAGTHTQR